MEAKVRVILQEGKEEEQKKYAIMSSYTVGKRVSKMVNEVNELRIEGAGFKDVVMDPFPDPVIIERPMEKTVGLDRRLEEVWRCIEDIDLQSIGIYGLGGVGKTTLLKKINNEFLNRSHGFDAVIWVSVSQQPNMKKIQGEILQQIPDITRETLDCLNIIGALNRRKFVLLLDDIWERLDLTKLGVPIHEMHRTGSKVVFTTRSLEICGLMEAQRKIKLWCLTPEAALNLFRTKVGEDTLNSHPLISDLAETMVAECNGLPLALVTVGRAMASRNNPEEWKHAIRILRNSPSDIRGMNDVLLLLKFSFNRLENDLLKSCFLYCSLFLEVRKEQLIELWIGEGFLGKSTDLYGRLINDRNKGEYIIGSLKGACLVVDGDSEEFVRMHQMIRDMALLECRGKIKVLTNRDAPPQAYGSGSFHEVERISFWDYTEIDTFCDNIKESGLQNLKTLIYRAPMLSSIPAGILPLMTSLIVLDLSNSFSLRELPAEIGMLINLQYLNLSETNISLLPIELRNLKKLRCLILNCIIPREMISNFQLLEVFISLTNIFFEEHLLDELEHLQHISEISIEINTSTSLTRLLRLPKLQQCLKKLRLRYLKVLNPLEVSSDSSPSFSVEVSPSLLRRMEHLELLSCELQEYVDNFPGNCRASLL